MRLPYYVLALLASSPLSHGAIDNQIIENEAASSITLAGKIGEAAIFSVQADDDNDLEIFATASSVIENDNDHWLLLDWDGSNYQIIQTGKLQAQSTPYSTGYQTSHSEVLLGHKGGLLSKITFSDDPISPAHTLDEQQSLLSEYANSVSGDIDFDIKAIVQLQGTDQIPYTVLCTSDYLHILNNNSLESSFDQGGYCQVGNVDYEKTAADSFDQELITENGLYLTFDGSNWTEKTNLVSTTLGDNFKVGNIDDDIVDEILSQGNKSQLQSYSPLGGAWVYISSIKEAIYNFNLFDSNEDGVKEIIFDHVNDQADPMTVHIDVVAWNDTNDLHYRAVTSAAPYSSTTSLKYLATEIIMDTPDNYLLFGSNEKVTLPSDKLLTYINTDLSITQKDLVSSSARNLDTVAKLQAGNNIGDYNLVQLEQIQVAEDTYEYVYKFFNGSDLTFTNALNPDFATDEVMTVDALSSFDFDADGVNELVAGGKANYLDPKGLVIASNQDGSVYQTLTTPTIASVSALHIGDINQDNVPPTPEIIAAGENLGDDGGIAIHILEDFVTDSDTWFKPGSGAIEFKSILASNIKGDDKPELLGLHNQLSSLDLNADINESKFYNLGNLDLKQFTPIALHNRQYEYALASGIDGTLHLIEPKDFDILASHNACSTEVTGITSVRVSNDIDIAFAVCEQSLLSWVIEFDPAITDYGYSLHPLQSTDLGNVDTSQADFSNVLTDDNTSHLFATFKNKFIRFELNRDLAADNDSDNYLNYEDAFPNEITQWTDADKDGYGDNPSPAVNPDPSLNDTDNDGVLNGSDADNTVDNGYPEFTSTNTAQHISSTGDLTNIQLTAPAAFDLFDSLPENGSLLPTITASTGGNSLTVNASVYSIDLEPGLHNVTWYATDAAANRTSSPVQAVNVYPSIAFKTNASSISETEASNIEIELSGESPVYPFSVEVSIDAGSSAINADLTEDISSNITITFEAGETSKSINLNAVNDSITESTEMLNLQLVDNFISDRWTIDSAKNSHALSILDFNTAPTISIEMSQDGIITALPTNIGGIITLDATISDSNALDTHTYLWDLSSIGENQALIEDVSFDPSSLTPNQAYTITLTVVDSGSPANTTIETFNLTLGYGDSDGDGVKDNLDAFPNDPLEQSDRDGDKVGDESDAFPDNANEHSDRDGDNVGDNSDKFPDNALESKDTDGDGIGDNADKFPNDKNEQVDTDGDGVGDNSDAFPNNALESKDTDGDGVGDNADRFPQDSRETKDTDNDGVGDNLDEFPNDNTRSNEVEGQEVESGSLYYLWFLLLPLLIRRKVKQ